MFQNDFETLVKDQISFSKQLIKKYPNTPIYIYAHSMGSFIGVEYMKTSSNIISGYIFAGSSYKQFFLWKFARYFSFFSNKLYKNKKSPLIHKLMFLGYDNKFKRDNLKNSWLTGNLNSVKDYNSNPLTGFIYSSSFYKDFFFFLDTLYNISSFKYIRKNIPILIVSGSLDPVGNFKKNIVPLKKFYLKLGFNNLKLKFFEDCRHELHNEKNNIEIFNYILNWIKKADY